MSEQPDRSFEGRVAFITGSTRGIGKCIALELAKRGCAVVVTGKTEDPNPKLPGTIQQTVDEIGALGGTAMGHTLDIRDDDAVGLAIARTVAVFGRLDFLINNAGAMHWRPIEQSPIKKFDLVMGVNARGAYSCSYHAVPIMRKQGFGHIIMMSPPVGTDGAAGKIAYSISKYGMTLIALGLAEELKGTNVAANALWASTMIETAAMINTGIGDKRTWRKPEIVADATLRILAKEPNSFTGHALLDEEFLRTEGVTDFTKYRCDPDHEPPHIPFSFKV